MDPEKSPWRRRTWRGAVVAVLVAVSILVALAVQSWGTSQYDKGINDGLNFTTGSCASAQEEISGTHTLWFFNGSTVLFGRDNQGPWVSFTCNGLTPYYVGQVDSLVDSGNFTVPVQNFTVYDPATASVTSTTSTTSEPSTSSLSQSSSSLNGTVDFTVSDQVLNLTQILAVSNPYTTAIGNALQGQGASGSWFLQVQLVNDSLVVPANSGIDFSAPIHFENATADVVLTSSAGQSVVDITASIVGDFSVGPLQMHQIELRWQVTE